MSWSDLRLPLLPTGSSIDRGAVALCDAGGAECFSIAAPTRARSRFVKSKLASASATYQLPMATCGSEDAVALRRRRETPNERLLSAARAGSAADVSDAIASGATELEEGFRAALEAGGAAAMVRIVERGALARAIGAVASVLHRHGLTPEERSRAQSLMLTHLATAEVAPAQYQSAVLSVLCAGACLRDGALLLGALVRDGHLDAAFPAADPGTRRKALKQALAINRQATRLSSAVSTSACDAVVCDSVRVPIRRRFRGYELAGHQLRLLEGDLAPWSPSVHKLYPKAFREAVRTLLLCARRYEPLAKMSEDLVHGETGSSRRTCTPCRTNVTQAEGSVCARMVALSPPGATHAALQIHPAACAAATRGMTRACPSPSSAAELIERLAYATFWGGPTVDLSEGEEVRRDPTLPAHKQPSCKRCGSRTPRRARGRREMDPLCAQRK